MTTARGVCFAALAVLGSACALGPRPRAPIGRYDFGPAPEASPQPAVRLPFVFVVHEASGPPWLDSGDMIYRLAYDEPERLRRYANSQWAVSPLSLVAERMRKGLGAESEHGAAVPDIGVPADYWLRLTVEEFGQVFDAPGSARGVVRLRATLTKGRAHAFVSQKGFLAQAPAPTPDARGGVTALRQALDDAVAEAVAWITGLVGPEAERGAAAR